MPIHGDNSQSSSSHHFPRITFWYLHTPRLKIRKNHIKYESVNECLKVSKPVEVEGRNKDGSLCLPVCM